VAASGARVHELAPWYILGWLAVLTASTVALFVARDDPAWVVCLHSRPPIYRYCDLVLWWLLVLIDRKQKRFSSFERNVLLLMGNVIELIVIEVMLPCRRRPVGNRRPALRWLLCHDASQPAPAHVGLGRFRRGARRFRGPPTLRGWRSVARRSDRRPVRRGRTRGDPTIVSAVSLGDEAWLVSWSRERHPRRGRRALSDACRGRRRTWRLARRLHRFRSKEAVKD
jgi:hypothetical protein